MEEKEPGMHCLHMHEKFAYFPYEAGEYFN